MINDDLKEMVELEQEVNIKREELYKTVNEIITSIQSKYNLSFQHDIHIDHYNYKITITMSFLSTNSIPENLILDLREKLQSKDISIEPANKGKLRLLVEY